MAMDLNETPEQRDFGQIIPDGTFVKVKAHLRPGGQNLTGADQIDAGLFKYSANSDAVMLDWEFTVLHGPHARQKLWQMTVVTGGSVDERGQSKAGNISKAMFRAMIDSACGLDPKDMSEAAKAKRVLRGFTDLDGIEFAARIGVEIGGDNPQTGQKYPDKNRVAHVVVPGEPEWQPVMSGQDVAPKPSGAVTPRAGNGAAAAAQAQKPAWQRDAAPGAAPPPAAAPAPAAPQPAWQNGGGAAAAPAAAAAASPQPAGPAWLRG